MKAVILAGGKGTRLSEETHLRPKPMVEIGGRPILWHVMKIFSKYGINDFIICTGYKGHMIKRYFAEYAMNSSDVTFNLLDHSTEVHGNPAENWRVSVIDTGEETMTGGRLLRIKDYLDEDTFMLTYGDGVSDVDLNKLMNWHYKSECLATLTAVRPPGRFGVVKFSEDENYSVKSFDEKLDTNETWINGGFFVLDKGVFNYIKDGDQTIWEQEPLRRLAIDKKLCGYKHEGFWQPMDTLRDKNKLDFLCNGTGLPPWL